MGYQNLAKEMDDDSKEKENLVSNIAIMVISMLVITLITVSVAANLSDSKDVAGNNKLLASVCGKTDEPESCALVLKNVGEKGTVMDYVRAGINATLEELLVVNMPKPDLVNSLTPLQKQSYIDCLELLKLAKEELVYLYNMANSSVVDIKNLSFDDVINSLSAVISYQQTCSNELIRTSSYRVLGYSLEIPIRFTRIILAIVNNFAEKPPARNMVGGSSSPQNDSSKAIPRSEHRLMEFHERYDGGGGKQEANVVVAKDGSGHFKTVTESLNACQKNINSPCIIYVKKGKYEERVMVPKNLEKVVMHGDGPLNTIVTGINTRDPNYMLHTTSFRAATFVVMGKGFICKDMGFIAPTGITGAPALLVLSDHAAFFNCKIDGEEGTLYAVAQRQFYRDCEIHGNVDIIKGDSSTLIQNSVIIVKPRNSSSDLALRKNVVSAQYRLDRYEGTGLVIQNCTITSQSKNLVASTYLATPRNEYSRTVIMESFLGDVIHPKGWGKWSDNFGIATSSFYEYDNRGPGANTDNRVRWNSYRTISLAYHMTNFTAKQFIQLDQWLQTAVIPYESWFISTKKQTN